MKNTIDLMAATLGQKAQSFDHIRSVTGLALTDDEFRTIVEGNPGRFRLVRIMKRDAEGAVIRPGALGVRMRTAAVS